MTAAEHQRIDALTNLVTDALAEQRPRPEAIAALRRFRALSPAGQRRVLALWNLQDTVQMLEAGATADAPFNVEIDAAKRWAKDMGRAARIPKGGER